MMSNMKRYVQHDNPLRCRGTYKGDHLCGSILDMGLACKKHCSTARFDFYPTDHWYCTCRTDSYLVPTLSLSHFRQRAQDLKSKSPFSKTLQELRPQHLKCRSARLIAFRPVDLEKKSISINVCVVISHKPPIERKSRIRVTAFVHQVTSVPPLESFLNATFGYH